MKQSGYTLIEIVVTIIVVGIIFLGIGGFVEIGAKGYGDTIDRQRLQNQARFVVEKISREVRHAIPNSFTVSTDGQCLSYYPIKYAGFYYHNEDQNTLEFLIGEKVISPPPTINALDYVVVNPSEPSDLELDSNSQRFQLSTAIQATAANVALDPTRFPTGAGPYFSIDNPLSSHSIAGRHYVYEYQEVSGAHQGAVTYCIESDPNEEHDQITRSFQGTTLQIGQNIVGSESAFEYSDPSLQRGGLVHLSFVFERGGDRSTYKHDIQVMNVQ
jgi:MSHA biogenesis protein MshO